MSFENSQLFETKFTSDERAKESSLVGGISSILGSEGRIALFELHKSPARRSTMASKR